MAVCPRSEQPSAARTPKPRSVKLRPLRTVRPTPVVLHPGDALFDAALEHQVFHQASHRVVGQRGHDGGVEAEAALQPARDVVLAAAFPHLERASGMDAAIARVEPQHHLAQGHAVPAAGFGGTQDELGHGRTDTQVLRCRSADARARVPKCGGCGPRCPGALSTALSTRHRHKAPHEALSTRHIARAASGSAWTARPVLVHL